MTLTDKKKKKKKKRPDLVKFKYFIFGANNNASCL